MDSRATDPQPKTSLGNIEDLELDAGQSGLLKPAKNRLGALVGMNASLTREIIPSVAFIDLPQIIKERPNDDKTPCNKDYKDVSVDSNEWKGKNLTVKGLDGEKEQQSGISDSEWHSGSIKSQLTGNENFFPGITKVVVKPVMPKIK